MNRHLFPHSARISFPLQPPHLTKPRARVVRFSPWRNHIRRCPRRRPNYRNPPTCSKCPRCRKCHRFLRCLSAHRIHCPNNNTWPLSTPLLRRTRCSPVMRCLRTSVRALLPLLRRLLSLRTRPQRTPRARRFPLLRWHPQRLPTIQPLRHLRRHRRRFNKYNNNSMLPRIQTVTPRHLPVP